MRGESMKGKSKKSTYSTTFGVDPENIAIEILSMALLFLIPIFGIYFFLCIIMEVAGVEPAS